MVRLALQSKGFWKPEKGKGRVVMNQLGPYVIAGLELNSYSRLQAPQRHDALATGYNPPPHSGPGSVPVDG